MRIADLWPHNWGCRNYLAMWQLCRTINRATTLLMYLKDIVAKCFCRLLQFAPRNHCALGRVNEPAHPQLTPDWWSPHMHVGCLTHIHKVLSRTSVRQLMTQKCHSTITRTGSTRWRVFAKGKEKEKKNILTVTWSLSAKSDTWRGR